MRETREPQLTAPYELYEEYRAKYGWRDKEGYNHAVTYDVFNKGWEAAMQVKNASAESK